MQLVGVGTFSRRGRHARQKQPVAGELPPIREALGTGRLWGSWKHQHAAEPATIPHSKLWAQAGQVALGEGEASVMRLAVVRLAEKAGKPDWRFLRRVGNPMHPKTP